MERNLHALGYRTKQMPVRKRLVRFLSEGCLPLKHGILPAARLGEPREQDKGFHLIWAILKINVSKIDGE